ncbi:MAG: PaaI family thioesterase [Ideonella sp.]|nr:PaaI family thioesterase [Ideonella sp.]
MSTKLKFPVHVPFVERLGLELHRCANGQSELRVDLQESHLNSWEVAHGGVMMTMLDVAMAMAARSDHLDGPGVATVEMKTSFMRPGEGELRALGQLLHRTATMAFCEARVLNSAGELCAHATGTFKYLRALPGKGRSLKPLQRSE